MASKALLLCFLALFAVAVGALPSKGYIAPNGFGDRLLRTFLLFKQQPLTMKDALSQGWSTFNGTDCVPGSPGIAVARSEYGPSEFNPTILYFSPNGQISGFGVRVWGTMSADLIQAGMLIPAADNAYDVYLTTRDPKSICSGQTYSQALGDRLYLNGFFPVPLDMSSAQAAGWISGNCIGKMGIHHAYDLSSPGNQTWNAATQVPILPMYDAKNHTINAILFNVWTIEDVEPIGDWEGPFTNSLYCLNWCSNSGCHWQGVTFWTTMHWHFVDPHSISCEGAPCKL